MKWVIKNPAPSDSRRRKWGDFHFGRSLTKYLERLGHDVVTHYDPGWDKDEPADVVLLLRGKYPFPQDTLHGGALRVMWNISHPAGVSSKEYEAHHLVGVASRPLARQLREQLEVEVHPLLQCTDTEEFQPPNSNCDREGIVFVGNSRDAERPGVLWALEYGIPLRIWGRGWEQFGVHRDQIQGDYLPNEELGELYARSYATLNDHWPDMKEYGFVNNRIFDALACGLPVVSDWHEELESLVPSGMLFYRNAAEFEFCLERVLLDYPSLSAGVEKAGEIVRTQFSFKRRTEELVALVEQKLAH